MQLKAKSNENLITIYTSSQEIIGELKIDFKTKQHQITIENKIYQIIQEKWETKVITNNQTVYHLKTDKFWGTIKIIELNKEIRGVFGFTWGTQLRDSYKQTLLKIRTENQIKNKGNYIIEVDKENIQSIEILLTLYGHIVGSIAKQNSVLFNI